MSLLLVIISIISSSIRYLISECVSSLLATLASPVGSSVHFITISIRISSISITIIISGITVIVIIVILIIPYNAPIFRLLPKVAVNGAHQCDFLQFAQLLLRCDFLGTHQCDFLNFASVASM